MAKLRLRESVGSTSRKLKSQPLGFSGRGPLAKPRGWWDRMRTQSVASVPTCVLQLWIYGLLSGHRTRARNVGDSAPGSWCHWENVSGGRSRLTTAPAPPTSAPPSTALAANAAISSSFTGRSFAATRNALVHRSVRRASIRRERSTAVHRPAYRGPLERGLEPAERASMLTLATEGLLLLIALWDALAGRWW
jgi:hypothetical protein